MYTYLWLTYLIFYYLVHICLYPLGFWQFVYHILCRILPSVVCIFLLYSLVFIFGKPLWTYFTHCMFLPCYLRSKSYRTNLICNILVFELSVKYELKFIAKLLKDTNQWQKPWFSVPPFWFEIWIRIARPETWRVASEIKSLKPKKYSKEIFQREQKIAEMEVANKQILIKLNEKS